tara:strand:- start:227 stop:1060 length:834 start_codon:yes stop_codon:yes gene_type:complete
MPFLILLGSFFFNTNFNKNTEIMILKQYLSSKSYFSICFIIFSLICSIHIINSEYFSKKFYEIYKIKEIDIRNNLQIGFPSQNEFHIDEKISIFFEKKNENTFYNIEALIYENNQLIVSDRAEIELSKLNFNLVFHDGEKIILNESEKSKTKFDKFIYVLEDKKSEKLSYDKEHYNTKELINSNNKEFINYGHNRIYQYFFLISILLISSKIIFFINKNKNILFLNSFICLFVLMLQIINSFLIYLLSNLSINVYIYYIINLTFLFFFNFFIFKFYK